MAVMCICACALVCGLFAGDRTPLREALMGVQIWGYGEEMTSYGFDNMQLPSIRIQTQGHRHSIMFPVEKVVQYIKSCRRGERVSYKDVMDFVQTVQPASLASYLSMFPDSDALCHVLLTKGSLSYVPAGWLLQEKARLNIQFMCTVTAKL